MPTIRRGEALWINVARAVNWLQPTDILPRLIFPGGASGELQTRVRQDLEATLAFFRTQYGIQADPDFTVYIPKDVEALIQALIQAYIFDGRVQDLVQDLDDGFEAGIRTTWDFAAGWAGSDIVVKQMSWPDDLSTDEVAWGRYTITHEYFHILQNQLSDPEAVGLLSLWLVEGTASWIDAEHAVIDGEQTWDDLRDGRLSEITDTLAPPLRSMERGIGWEYTLGWLATDRLIADGEPDSAIEFWRRLLAPTDWRTAFHEVSGQPVSEFDAAFNAWQRTAAGYDDGNWIRGKVVVAVGAAAHVFVDAIRVEGETSVDLNQRTETAGDGSFAVWVPEAGDYILSVDNGFNCIRYYSDGQLIDDLEEARPVKVSQSDISIDIRLPPDVCGWPGLWR